MSRVVETPEPKGWYFRFDLKSAMKFMPSVSTREFKLPFEHAEWIGPFKSQADAVLAAQDAFGLLANTPVINRREYPV